MRIRQVVELDTQHLRWLRSELRSRTDWFEGLSEEMADLAKERNETRERLEALDADPESDPDEVEALRAELKELEVDYGLFDTQADLALTAEKAVREQVAALEEKLAFEKRALGELTGEIEIELPEAPAPAPAPTAQPTEPGKAPPVPLPVPVPAAQPPAKKETTSSSTMTTAQLEAHHLLDQAERDVELAKLALAEFVERKQALEEQIEFEEDLSETHAKEVENLKLALEAFEARLQKYRDTDAPDEKIQRTGARDPRDHRTRSRSRTTMTTRAPPTSNHCTRGIPASRKRSCGSRPSSTKRKAPQKRHANTSAGSRARSTRRTSHIGPRSAARACSSSLRLPSSCSSSSGSALEESLGP